MTVRTRLDADAEEARKHLQQAMPSSVRVGIILGSGLGTVREGFETVTSFPYREIPHFPTSTVQGHRGELVLAKKGAKRVLIMDGRVHHYEGYSLSEVTFPMLVLRKMGVRTMIITNAAGGISVHLSPGDIMLIRDHINLIWSVLPRVDRGPQVLHGPYYSKRLLDLAVKLAAAEKMPIKTGVLLAATGPCYETRSEVEFARKIGADAVTMSTVPEVTVCHQLGMSVVGMSLITNMAAGHSGGHDLVVSFAQSASCRLGNLILRMVEAM